MISKQDGVAFLLFGAVLIMYLAASLATHFYILFGHASKLKAVAVVGFAFILIGGLILILA